MVRVTMMVPVPDTVTVVAVAAGRLTGAPVTVAVPEVTVPVVPTGVVTTTVPAVATFTVLAPGLSWVPAAAVPALVGAVMVPVPFLTRVFLSRLTAVKVMPVPVESPRPT